MSAVQASTRKGNFFDNLSAKLIENSIFTLALYYPTEWFLKKYANTFVAKYFLELSGFYKVGSIALAACDEEIATKFAKDNLCLENL